MKSFRTLGTLVFILFVTFNLQAQNDLKIKDANGNILLEAREEGILIKKATTAQRTGFSLGAADNGLLVYDTTVGAFFTWNGSQWVEIDGTDLVDDADANPNNETNTSLSLSGNNLQLTDAGGTLTTDLTSFKDSKWLTSGGKVYRNSQIAVNGVPSSASFFTFQVFGDHTNFNILDLTPSSNGEQLCASFESDANTKPQMRYRSTGSSKDFDIGLNQNDDFVIEVNDGDKFIVEKDGDVGIGISSPAFKLQVNGSAAKPGGGSWSTTSDRRLKQDITPFSEGLEKVLAIKPVTYHYNDQSGYDTEKEHVGVIAQELQEIAPYMVGSYQQKPDGETYLNVDNSAMVYMLINAVKEQQAQIEELKAEITKLKRQ